MFKHKVCYNTFVNKLVKTFDLAIKCGTISS